ncbi:MAG: shikimate kinase [Thermodesulfobacteriota bacterium]|nr:shikimate kinase [Thermodesulfobacteriota bacterium]
MKNIILIGYRCTGKSSVGRILADRLASPFFDTDDVICKEAGMSIRDIVESGGWARFRKREKAVINNLLLQEGSVIATGGGALDDSKNKNDLKQNGLFIWLTAEVKIIMERMISDRENDDKRPSLSNDGMHREIVTTLEKREPVYKNLAHLTIDTSGKTLHAISDEIIECLESFKQTDQRK